MDKHTLQPAVDAANWTGDQLGQHGHWKVFLSHSQIDDLVAMAKSLQQRLNNNPDKLLTLNRNDFDLGSFQPQLNAVYQQLRQGPGVVLVKGLSVAQLTPLEIATIYWGIGKHLGDAMPNNPQGDMIGHVTDLGKTQSDPNSRGYQTREAMDYHCDQCDIVGLLCRRPALTGGVSKVASSVAMYNTLLQNHPELAEALASPLCWTKHGEHATDESPFYQSPVFNFLQGKLCTSFGPKHIIKGHELPGTPALTHLQRTAITTAENIAEQQHLAMNLEAGDMQFLNNYVTLHTRTAYTDFDSPENKRLLWRLWLMNDDLRPRTGYSTQWQHGVSLGKHSVRVSV